MLLSLIAALDRNGLIGAGGGLPWRLPRDLRRFRALTWGKPVIVGRTTHDLIGPLPGRHHIVLSRRPEPPASGCPVAAGLDDALAQAGAFLVRHGGDEALVIGGARVYRDALPRCRRCYLTLVEGDFHGDAWFPLDALAAAPWRVAAREAHPADERNPHPHRFLTLERTDVPGPDAFVLRAEWLAPSSVTPSS
jgi:dihydrofolate reductase